jgi:hypothetical protein
VAAARPLIDSATVDGLTSDKVLAHLRPGLLKLGYEVEGGKHRAEGSGSQYSSATKSASASPTRSTPSTMSWASWRRSRPGAVREATLSIAISCAPR